MQLERLMQGSETEFALWAEMYVRKKISNSIRKHTHPFGVSTYLHTQIFIKEGQFSVGKL